ncbi:MAG: D-aminoacylase [Caulobacteraceae bacterium]
MHDLVIRNGMIVDGQAGPAFKGDVAVDGGLISQVGVVEGQGRREIDAAGHIVTPGWVDIHTHYDGQVTWDPYLSPSSWHGVTTAVMGNCGVGFAPVKPDRKEWLIELMEGVEDIPGAALSEGIKWGWESFPEYMDVLEGQKRVIDIAAQVPHGAVRAYVMGERGARNEEATPEDIAQMSRIVGDSMKAGALGFSTSRTILHRAKDGEVVPGTYAGADELLGIGKAMGEAGHGVFEMASDMATEDAEFAWMEEMSVESGLPVTFALLQGGLGGGDKWRHSLKRLADANGRGAQLKAQIACRPTGLVLGWQSTVNPFFGRPSYHAIATLPFPERLEKLRDPEVREAILAEPPPEMLMGVGKTLTSGFDRMFRLNTDRGLDYEPRREDSIASLAEKTNQKPDRIVYEMLMENDGRGYIYLPLLNYADFSFDHIHEMMHDPNTVLSLSDGGAHCGVICDASFPTYMLTYWVRDRERGPTLSLEKVVSMQTRDTARLYGLNDRGVLAAGMKADINIIDFDELQIEAPEMIFDLPAEGRRLIQRARGYRATVVSGEVTWENGQATGAMPGKLIRGPQHAPVPMAAE